MPNEMRGNPAAAEAISQVFTEARTYVKWISKPVKDEMLHAIYDLLKFGPTSANSTPARFVFVRTREAKEKLKPALSPGNVDKTMSAPVTAIVAYDEKFYEHMGRLFPHNPGMGEGMKKMPAPALHDFVMRNGSLQGAYLIIAARLLGLDCGPMSGFDNAKVDDAFFAGTSWKSNFLCNLGYGDPAPLLPRSPRLEFEEACRIE